MARDITEMALVQGLEAEQVGRGANGRGGAFALPVHGGGVVMEVVGCALSDIRGMGQDVMVQEGASELQVAIVDGAMAVAGGDKQGRDGGIKLGPPKNGSREEMHPARMPKPDASDAPMVVGCCGRSSAMRVGREDSEVASQRKSWRKSWTLELSRKRRP